MAAIEREELESRAKKILKYLTPEEQEILAKYTFEELRTLFTPLLRLPTEFFIGYAKAVQGIKPTIVEESMLKEFLGIEEYRTALKHVPAFFFKFPPKEVREYIRNIITIKRFAPELLIPKPPIEKPPPVKLPPPAPPPVIPPAIPSIEEVRERMEKIVVPRGWRSLWPFKTFDFIKKFFIYKGKEGTYPYEVFKIMRRTLVSTIGDPDVRSFLLALEGIPVNGIINGELISRLKVEMPKMKKKRYIIKEEDTTVHIPYHYPSYNTIRKYFYILHKLKLIERISKKEGKFGYAIPRQYYVINEEMVDSVLWKNPQVFMYPMCYLGKKRYNELKEMAEKVEERISESFLDMYPELVTYVAGARGIPEEKLIEMIVLGEYREKKRGADRD